jgi:ribosomal protein S18 acetylase RimI-like enzyme
MSIEIHYAYGQVENIRNLFREYTNMLMSKNPHLAQVLKAQDYDTELEKVNDIYGLPDGRLYIAQVDEVPAGCMGLKKLNQDQCEMKRLYVKPEFRGRSIAKKLIEKMIRDAKHIGYRYIMLETFPFLIQAIRLYEKYRFTPVDAYYNSPIQHAIYMRLDVSIPDS